MAQRLIYQGDTSFSDLYRFEFQNGSTVMKNNNLHSARLDYHKRWDISDLPYQVNMKALQKEEVFAMDIGKANNSTIEAILTLNTQIHVDTPLFQGDSYDWVEEQVENGNYFVIKENNEICGAICLLEKDGIFHLETISVQKEQQRKGIGQQFIDFAKTKAKENGFDRVYVDTYCEYNVDKFYEKCGFRKIPTYAKYRGKPYHRFFIDLNS